MRTSSHTQKTKIPHIGFISLGCPKALVDSERILSQLRAEGYQISSDYNGSDLVVVNTCGFIDSAVEESLEAIGEALNENGKVIVTGCLGAKGSTVQDRFPNVLAVTGPHALDEVMEAIHHHIPKPHEPFLDLIPEQGIKLTPAHYAYLKIAEGCNHRCTFCIIPALRGDLVSRPIGDVMQEAENLVQAGVKELLIVSQDTSAYGLDMKYRTGFWHGRPMRTRFFDLVKALGELDVWTRLHYVYPYPHVDEVLPLMAEGKILPYLDIPFQHASPSVLKAMKRPGDIEKTLERIQKWRQICPDLVIRSTFIVGFPGETDEDFEELCDFLEAAQLDRVGCFTYSPVEGALANELANPIDELVKQERQAQLMLLQEEISTQKLAKKHGKILEVIIDDVDEEGFGLGRTKGDAPEIDGVVYITPSQNQPLIIGERCHVKVTDSDAHDLWADAQ